MISLNTVGTLGLDQTPEVSEQEEHICATCSQKQRVMVSSPDGTRLAFVWRCRELTHRFHTEILVEPKGSCYDSNSMTDYWSKTKQEDLVW